jgi:hypothetical protein
MTIDDFLAGTALLTWWLVETAGASVETTAAP